MKFKELWETTEYLAKGLLAFCLVMLLIPLAFIKALIIQLCEAWDEYKPSRMYE